MSRGVRVLLVSALATLIVVAAGCTGNGASQSGEVGGETKDTQVYFVSGAKMQPVPRTVPADSAMESAIEELIAGPTNTEMSAGLYSDVPEDTELLSYSLADDEKSATVDFSDEFASETSEDPLDNEWVRRKRIAQVTLTVTEEAQVDEVRILVEGKEYASETSSGVTEPSEAESEAGTHADAEETHEKTAPKVDVADVQEVQRELIRMKYLPPEGATGTYDYRTKQAVMAFQAIEGLQRDGDVGPQTTAALRKAQQPVPPDSERETGKIAQIYRDKGVVFFSEDGELVRVVHTSTGKPGYETPTGRHEVYSQEKNHWSHSYNVNLPWASFFHEGYAFHEYPEVPAQPASHGCSRMPSPEAPWVYDFLDKGTPVYVY